LVDGALGSGRAQRGDGGGLDLELVLEAVADRGPEGDLDLVLAAPGEGRGEHDRTGEGEERQAMPATGRHRGKDTGMAPARDVQGVIEAFAAHARSAGVFADFDGTLAPIVDDPATARPLAGAAEALEALAGSYARVHVISGRPGSFLADHLGGRGLALTGLYGLEVVTPDGVRPVAGAKRWRSVVEEVASRAEAELPPAL